MKKNLLPAVLLFLAFAFVSCEDELPDDNLPQTPKTGISLLSLNENHGAAGIITCYQMQNEQISALSDFVNKNAP